MNESDIRRDERRRTLEELVELADHLAAGDRVTAHGIELREASRPIPELRYRLGILELRSLMIDRLSPAQLSLIRTTERGR